jgi:hypothetical protein
MFPRLLDLSGREELQCLGQTNREDGILKAGIDLRSPESVPSR